MNTETFELDLWGGAAESRYRTWRPEVEALPWADLSGLATSESELVAARRSWTASSLQEYATAAAHAATVNLLVRIRAPLDLSALASRFPLDELVHAELCARMANALGGGAPVTYLPDEVFPAFRGEATLADVTERIVRDCCVSETLATALLRRIGRGPGPELLRKVHRAIARDEAVHGRFGWIFLEWAAPKLGASELTRLGHSAAKEIAINRTGWKALLSESPETLGQLTVFGGVSAHDYVGAGEHCLESRVLPLLRGHGVELALTA
jgi:hypothetical protein